MDLRVRYQPVTEDISDDDEEVEKGQKTNKTDISLHNWWPWRPWALQCVSSMENETTSESSSRFMGELIEKSLKANQTNQW